MFFSSVVCFGLFTFFPCLHIGQLFPFHYFSQSDISIKGPSRALFFFRNFCILGFNKGIFGLLCSRSFLCNGIVGGHFIHNRSHLSRNRSHLSHNQSRRRDSFGLRLRLFHRPCLD
ncbi:hypothetical protein V8G54_021482 [Vigna mungo]|uniref:Uncharacterized protein n=1 Tax=Vigna mungo TaxID=3915 RepID=A0AAQ3NFP7_VIGMU